jgi:3-hydroxyisobutyrate dehydrogenase
MTNAKEIKTVGFIGIGIMGHSMAGHLLAGGYAVNVYNRTKSKTDAIVAKGATWYDTPGAIAAHSDVVITMVGFPSDVEEVYLGDVGIIKNAKPGTILIDMTTSSPSLARKISEIATANGMFALDAPVSGGDIGARDAKLNDYGGWRRKCFQSSPTSIEAHGCKHCFTGWPGYGAAHQNVQSNRNRFNHHGRIRRNCLC